jgi:soluble lytic murein transglycosylase-like protein
MAFIHNPLHRDKLRALSAAWALRRLRWCGVAHAWWQRWHARLLVLLPLLVAIAGSVWAGGGTTRYRCILADGSTRMVAQDLSAVYGGGASSCVPVRLQASMPQPYPVVPPEVVSKVRIDVRVSLRGMPPVVLLGPLVADPNDPLAGPHGELIRQAARRYRVDARLLGAVAHVESRQRADARSPKGALGVMQIMPATGARYGVYQSRNLFDPAINIDVGAQYLNDLLEMFEGRVDLALAAYNAGEGAVTNYGNRIPPYPETRRYVRDVLTVAGRAPAAAHRTRH